MDDRRAHDPVASQTARQAKVLATGITSDALARRGRSVVARSATVGAMSREITQRELRNDSGKVMRGLDEGETFIVTRNGVPVGELTPLRRHRFVPAETAVALFNAAPAVDFRRFRDDLDAAACQDATPRG